MKFAQTKSPAEHTDVHVGSLKPKDASFFHFNHSESQPFFGPATVQPKLKIGEPNDKYEKQADRVADAVMKMSEPSNIQAKRDEEFQMKSESIIQTKCKEYEEQVQLKPAIQTKCSDCEKEERLQTKGNPTIGNQSHINHNTLVNTLNADQGKGNRLPAKVQNDLGRKMNADFRGVNIHTDSKSVTLNQQLGARAFTHGNDIYFNQGQYDANSYQGKHLLAHELVHVMQQSGSESKTIQKRDILENDPSSAPSMTCPLPSNSVSDYTMQVQFGVGGSALTALDKTILANFATEWNLSSVQPIVRIDGFASIDGSPASNWPLSCDRAVVVAAELNAPSVGGRPGIPNHKLELFANGETDRFSSGLLPNRVAAVQAPGLTLPTSNEPSVHDWTVKNTGSTDANNCCGICPVNLGVDSDPSKYKNAIELNPSIRDHDPAYTYDIKRTKETKYHRRKKLPFGLTGPWKNISSLNKPAGSDDDRHNSDECRAPVVDGSIHNIFSIDTPGFKRLGGSYKAYLQKINFVEFVRVQRPDGSTFDDTRQQNWHTILLVEKNRGSWVVNTAESEIGPGHLGSLDP